MVNIIVLALVGFMAMASGANAAGFRLSEQDAKANGMGNSFVAVADNASAVWYNPAAMTELEKTNLSLGTVMVAPAMKHEFTGGSDEIKNTLHIPPYLYATHRLNEKWALGFGFNAPFGLSTEWNKTTARTRFVATLSDIKALNYNINGAYKLNDKLSFGLGADYVSLDAKLYQSAGGVNEIQLSGDGTGWGYNAAAFYKLNKKWSFGANYRSPVKVLISGTAKNTAASTSNHASTSITLPDTFQAGAAYKANAKWLVSATADYTDWATYHALKINSATFGGTAISYKGWQSVWAFRLGTEYKYSDKWNFRAGTFYDWNPVKEKYFETRVPDSDRVAFSLGAGYVVAKNITVDLSYTYLMFVERTIHNSVQDDTGIPTALNGKYKTSAHLPALGVNYKF